jgi:hypothetical protein
VSDSAGRFGVLLGSIYGGARIYSGTLPADDSIIVCLSGRGIIMQVYEKTSLS